MRRLLCLLVVLVAAGTPAQAACSMTPTVSLPLYPTDDGKFTVPMTISGQEFRLVVDTGAYMHTVTSSVVDQLKLERVPVTGKAPTMTGGAPLSEYITAKDIALGGLKTPELQMFVLPDARLAGVDGLLAAALFSHYDVELDYAAGRMNLFTPCSGRGAYWAHASTPIVLPFLTDATNHIHFEGKLGGKTVDVLIDTGASETAADISTMTNFGLTPTSAGVRIMGDKSWYRYSFDKLELGSLTLPNAEVAFVNGPRNRLYVGSRILRQYHVLISYIDKTLTLTNASDDPARTTAVEAFSSAYDALIHHDYDSARTLYTAALASPALPPSYRAAVYYGRSQADLNTKQCSSAKTDLNSAIAQDPLTVVSRRAEPSPYVKFLQKKCPETTTGPSGAPQ